MKMATSTQGLNKLDTAHHSKWLAVWEIVSVLTSCLIAEWVVLAFAGRTKLVMAIPVIMAMGLIIFSHRERGESLRDIGFRTDNLAPALRLLLLPTLVAIVAIVAVAFFVNHSILIAPWRNRFLALPIWALFQQYVLNGFINRRAQIALGGGRWSILIVGLSFALVHLPNPLLAVLTLIGGLIWASAYQRVQNLFALALSHSAVSIMLALTAPSNLLNSLRVGFKYFG